MIIRIYPFVGNTYGTFTAHSRFPNSYCVWSGGYDGVCSFFNKYIEETLSPIPSDINDSISSQLHLASQKRRESVQKEREKNAVIRAQGGYCPDFENKEIAFLLFDNLLVYNAWQSKYKLTHKLLYDWLYELEKSGVKENDISLHLFKHPLSQYLEKNSTIIGNDYAYVHMEVL